MSTELIVSDIQHFSLGDGDGIRTTVFLKGCPLRCPWCHNPETQMRQPQTLVFKANGKSVLYGKTMTPAQIAAEVMPDKPFYEESGGGVTVSGGEPLTQPQGVAELARLLFESGISVLIDTAGDVPFTVFEQLLPYVDTYYIDLKTADRDEYRTVIGADLDRICDNIRKLTALGKRVHVRIPLIPGFNDSEQQSTALCELISTLGTKSVDLLPFHRLGVAKYEALNREYAYRDTEPYTKTETEAIASRFRGRFTVTVEY